MDDGYSEKRKKSWKEIDQQRDGSAHRRPEKKPDVGARPGRSSQRYRAALEKAFDTGNMGKVAERLTSAKPDAPKTGGPQEKSKSPSRQKLIHAVTSAAHTKQAIEAFDILMEHYGLPDDFDALTRGLEHPDDDVILAVMQKLKTMLETEKPRRSKTLLARLRLLEDDFDKSEEIKTLAVAIQRLL